MFKFAFCVCAAVTVCTLATVRVFAQSASPCSPGGAGAGDHDVDGDVDHVDWRALADCLAGPGAVSAPVLPLTPAVCAGAFDLDGDADVDLRDAAGFALAYSGMCSGETACPEGTLPLHESGALNDPQVDTSVSGLSLTEFSCVEEQSCTGTDCSGRGSCVEVDGYPACACDPGYAGSHCEQCAVGYQRTDPVNLRGGLRDLPCVLGSECRERFCSGQGTCYETGTGDIACACDSGTSGDHCENGGGNPTIPRPPTRVVITGTDASLSQGDSSRLEISAFGGGAVATDFTWELTGPGTLSALTGSIVTYTAPPPDGTLVTQTAAIKVCTASFPDHCATRYLTIDPPGGIPTSGQSHAVFEPLDDMMRSFMRRRCIGGAVLGVSVFGKLVHVKGFGSLSGAPTNDATYLTECGDMFDVSGLYGDLPLPAPAAVLPETPFRLASVSKAVNAAVVREAVRDSGVLGPNPSDTQIESMRICEASWDLLPPDLFDVLCGVEAPPMPLQSATGRLPDCTSDDPCPYGGTCTPTMGDLGICDDCPPGFSGWDCSINESLCADLSMAADLRWDNVTLGHLFGHRTGMHREGVSVENVVIPNLDILRGFDPSNEANWGLEESALLAECGFPDGCFNAEFPAFGDAKDDIDPGYFVQRPTVQELTLAIGGTCLLSNPGSSSVYSNAGYNLLSLIVEHVAGLSFAGKTGKPGLHSGSALEDFLQGEVGVPLPGQQTAEGIFFSQESFRVRETAEPVYRHWSNGTYYPRSQDDKRPHCSWTGSDCSFSDWINGVLRFDWDFLDKLPLLTFTRSSFERLGGRGGLAAEAAVYLKFMSRFWVGDLGGSSNPRYGETRCPGGNCIWSQFIAHNGSLDGTYAFALQFGGPIQTNRSCNSDADCFFGEVCLGPTGSSVCYSRNSYKLPLFDPCTDDYSDNFGDLVTHQCRLPVGVDIFVAVNQRRDKKCAEAEALDENSDAYYTCDAAYGLLDDFVYHGVCQVPWPPNPFVIWPPVLNDGGSGMDLGVGGGKAAATAALRDFPDLPCCGDGVKEPGEICDTTDFGGLSCASYGYEMGDLTCVANCGTVSTANCSGGISNLPPGSYAACGYDLEECNGSPSGCNADGDCPGGPCAVTDPGDYYGALDPQNFQGEFHPDGNFRDQQGNLYFCRDDTQHGEMACVDENGWGVCRRCAPGGGELNTGLGCPCDSEAECDNWGAGLACHGDDFPGAVGFCWDSQDGPPPWHCLEGSCGMAPWYGDDEMYCEHYSISGTARCEPWYACNPILARVCAGENLICEENALGCTDDDCCTSACLDDGDCSPAFGWPAGYTCENTGQGLQCVGP